MALLAQRQRLRLLACLATSNFKSSFRGPCWAPATALLPKCEGLQIARRQKELACKAIAQPHLPMALLAQRHRDWVCFLVLPSQTSKVSLWNSCREPPSSLLPKCERLEIARSQKELAGKAVAQPHLRMAVLVQRHRAWGYLLVLPPQSSNVAFVVRALRLRRPCSQNANFCR